MTGTSKRVAAVLDRRRSNAASTHLDKRTKRNRSRAAQMSTALHDQKDNS
jgi:hypothetical protein